MNEEDEIISVRRLRSTRTSSVSDDASRLGPRLVEELSETACSPRARKRISQGIVWQAPPLRHAELALTPLSAKAAKSQAPCTPRGALFNSVLTSTALRLRRRKVSPCSR
jgi:hypothetical protein